MLGACRHLEASMILSLMPPFKFCFPRSFFRGIKNYLPSNDHLASPSFVTTPQIGYRTFYFYSLYSSISNRSVITYHPSSNTSTKSKSETVLLAEGKPYGPLHVLFLKKNARYRRSRCLNALNLDEPVVLKDLSDDMISFVKHLYDMGYFLGANPKLEDGFDISFFQNCYGREYIKFAAEKFGQDNQQIARWLSVSALKKIALFGCPCLLRRSVFAAKWIRSFFEIHEETVCGKCTLKESCAYKNKIVWKRHTKNLKLSVVMNVISSYALELIPHELHVPEDIKASVLKLFRDVLRLSKAKS